MTESWVQQEEQITQDVADMVGDQKVDAILCVAGGWAGGNAASKSLCFRPLIYIYKHIIQM